MRRRLRAHLAKALLVTVSVLLTYAIAEVVFFRVALPYLSLSTLPHIPDRAAFFLQGSKRENVPHDYIALVGDSNAQGMGDWLIDNGLDRSKPYHSADILQDDRNATNCDQRVPNAGRTGHRVLDGRSRDAPAELIWVVATRGSLEQLILLNCPISTWQFSKNTARRSKMQRARSLIRRASIPRTANTRIGRS
jgi:hypothetical protein